MPEKVSDLWPDASPRGRSDVVWNFMIAELDSDRWGPRLRPHIGPELTIKLESGKPATLSDEDATQLERLLLAHRSGFVRPLLVDSAVWFEATLEADRFPNLRIAGEQDFIRRAPSRKLIEFARRTDLREPEIADFDLAYAQLRANFMPAKMHGLPILVSPALSDPLTIAEGTSRLTCMMSKILDRTLRLDSTSVLIGVDPGFKSWHWL